MGIPGTMLVMLHNICSGWGTLRRMVNIFTRGGGSQIASFLLPTSRDQICVTFACSGPGYFAKRQRGGGCQIVSFYPRRGGTTEPPPEHVGIPGKVDHLVFKMGRREVISQLRNIRTCGYPREG